MKTLKVPYLEALNNIDIQNAGDVLDENGQRDTVDVLNWATEYPYRPITYFNIARSNDGIFIQYNVHGSMLRAIYSNDMDPVNEDSCVEFFFSTSADVSQGYFNVEMNCGGTMLLHFQEAPRKIGDKS